MDKRYINDSMKQNVSLSLVALIALSTCIALIPVSSHWQWIKPDLFLLCMLFQYSKQKIRSTSPILIVCLGFWLTMLYPYYLGALSMLYIVTHMVLCMMEAKAKTVGYGSMLLREFLLIAAFHCIKLCVFSASLSPDVLDTFQLTVGYHLVVWLILRAVTIRSYAVC